MNTNNRSNRVPTRFSRKTRFELQPRFGTLDLTRNRFEQLKALLLDPVLTQTPNDVLRRQLTLAANEAAAIAWTTPFPLLVLPELLQEKAAEVHRYAEHQEQVQATSEFLAELAE